MLKNAGYLLLVLIAATLAAVLPTSARDQAQANHEITVFSRPAHLPQKTAHFPSVPTGSNSAAVGMQSGYDYWNLASFITPVNTYQNPVTFYFGQYDLLVDYMPQGQTSCIYDDLHCITVDSSFYARVYRWGDLNVQQVVWNATQYSTSLPNVDGIPWNSFTGRHELGHDNYLDDHLAAPYSGLMCNGGSCTQKSAASTAELNAASSYLQARPIPPTGIAVTAAVTDTSVTVNFVGHGNTSSLLPQRNTSLDPATWVTPGSIPPSSTTYTFQNLSPGTTYNFHIYSALAGQPAGASHWVTATTRTIAAPTGFQIHASTSSTVSISWSAVPGAASYQYCILAGPNPGGSMFCSSVGTNLSAAVSPPPGAKSLYYYAARAVAGIGGNSALSNRGTVTSFNETVGGVAYTAYHTAYKDSSGQKVVNGFNRQIGTARWLAFSNTIASDDIKNSVPANSQWFSPSATWAVPDYVNPLFGPLILAVESPNSSLSPQDSIWHSTYCMIITPGCE